MRLKRLIYNHVIHVVALILEFGGSDIRNMCGFFFMLYGLGKEQFGKLTTTTNLFMFQIEAVVL